MFCCLRPQNQHTNTVTEVTKKGFQVQPYAVNVASSSKNIASIKTSEGGGTRVQPYAVNVASSSENIASINTSEGGGTRDKPFLENSISIIRGIFGSN